MVAASQSLHVGCPDDETLEQFKVGLLTERDLEAIAAHLALCPSCEARLAEAERSGPDPLVQQIRKCVAEAPSVGISLSSLLRSLSSRRPAVDSSAAETVDDKPGPGSTDVESEAPRIAHYELLKLLGSGGMGEVYLAWDTRLQRTVALKVIKAKSHTALTALARFHREAKAIAKLDHPGIVKLYDFGEAEGVDYLCMEHVDGGTLYEKLKGENKPSYREAAELLRALALAMQHAHAQNIIHRDLKPGNILLTAEGLPKIADFGLAKLLHEDDTLTRTNVVVGTPVYMGPEQASGDAQRVGPLSDQYALGVILYEMLTGTVPFRGKDNRETLLKVCMARLIPPSTLRSDVPVQLEAICLRALSRDPADRYANTQELAEDLGRYLADQPLKPEPLIRQVCRSKWTKRVAAAALSACLLFSACMIYAAVTTPDPEAKLREYETAMAAGHPIELIGEKGYPHYYRWTIGKSSAKVALAADGHFAVHTWSKCMIELLPRVRWPAYRVCALVRHDAGAPGGCAGIYCGHHENSAAELAYQSACVLEYNDVRNPEDYQLFSPKTNRVLGHNFNLAQLTCHLFTAIDGRYSMFRKFPGNRSHSFSSAGSTGETKWRKIELIVTPKKISGRMDGQPFDGWAMDDLNNQLAAFSVIHAKDDSIHAGVTKPAPAFSPEGAIGVYVFRASVSLGPISVETVVDEENSIE